MPNYYLWQLVGLEEEEAEETAAPVANTFAAFGVLATVVAPVCGSAAVIRLAAFVLLKIKLVDHEINELKSAPVPPSTWIPSSIP